MANTTNCANNFCLEVLRVHAEGLINIHEARNGPEPDNCADAATPQVTGQQDLIAGSDPQGGQSDVQAGGGASQPERMSSSKAIATCLLQAIHHVLRIGAIIAKWTARPHDAARGAAGRARARAGRGR